MPNLTGFYKQNEFLMERNAKNRDFKIEDGTFKLPPCMTLLVNLV